MFDYRKILKTAAVGLIIGFVCALSVSHGIGKISVFISNCLCFGGIVLLIYGMFSLATYLGLFNTTRNGFDRVKFTPMTHRIYDIKDPEPRKLRECETNDSPGKNYREALAIGAFMLILSIILTMDLL